MPKIGVAPKNLEGKLDISQFSMLPGQWHYIVPVSHVTLPQGKFSESLKMHLANARIQGFYLTTAIVRRVEFSRKVAPNGNPQVPQTVLE